MNISTYEARIKALEDQLNPPAPGGSTGLLSVTVTPDITLSDGTSLNAKLAELMPMTSGVKSLSRPPETPLEEGAEYSFVITPASGDMAGYKAGVNNTLSDEEGAPLSGSASVVDGVFDVNVFSFNGLVEDEGEMFPNETATVEIYIGYSGN